MTVKERESERERESRGFNWPIFQTVPFGLVEGSVDGVFKRCRRGSCVSPPLLPRSQLIPPPPETPLQTAWPIQRAAGKTSSGRASAERKKNL